jgi:hypothetical protein
MGVVGPGSAEHAGSHSQRTLIRGDLVRVVGLSSAKHAGSCSSLLPALDCARHGRRRCAHLPFRLATESFGSARRWTHERVSAAGERLDFWVRWNRS